MMTTLERDLQNKIDQKTKPIGALGYLEKIAFQIGNIQQTLNPVLKAPTIIVFAADHGLAQDGVSAYPAAVTQQMVLNFLNGGAAINIFCNQHQIALKIVDAGVNFDFTDHPNLLKEKAGYGTQSSLRTAAMTREQLDFCLAAGKKQIETVVETETNIIGFGEMGIGNTAAASLLMSRLLNLPIAACVGKGTGISDAQLQHKTEVLEQVLQQHPDITHPLDVLQYFGGFEIAQICGAMLHAYQHNMILLIDGFIASCAFLVAQAVAPEIIKNAIFCHQSDEKGHQLLLEHLGAEALLKLNLRLGEGTGCALAYPLIESAVAFLNTMASFESAKISKE